MYRDFGNTHSDPAACKDSQRLSGEQQYAWFSNNKADILPDVAPAASPLTLPPLIDLPASLSWGAGERVGRGYIDTLLNKLEHAIECHSKAGLPVLELTADSCPYEVHSSICSMFRKSIDPENVDISWGKEAAFIPVLDANSTFFNINLEFIEIAPISKQRRDFLFRMIALVLKENRVAGPDWLINDAEDYLYEYHKETYEECEEGVEPAVYLYESQYIVPVDEAKFDLARMKVLDYFYSFIPQLDTDNLESDLAQFDTEPEFREAALDFIKASRTVGDIWSYCDEFHYQNDCTPAAYLFYITPDSNNFCSDFWMSWNSDGIMNNGIEEMALKVPYDQWNLLDEVDDLRKSFKDFAKGVEILLCNAGIT